MSPSFDSTSPAMLRVDDLTKSFDQHHLWSDLNLRFEPGMRIALTGASGSGKSTLLNCLGLLEQPTNGTIYWGDHNLTALNSGGRRRFRRDHLGYLFQDYALIEDATVAENLLVALNAWGSRNSIKGNKRLAVAQALDQVGLSGREKDRTHILSGGEQQRVAMARILLRLPEIVLADEPTAALDGENGELVLSFLDDMAHRGSIVVIATHHLDIRDRCDEVVHLPGNGDEVHVTSRIAAHSINH